MHDEQAERSPPGAFQDLDGGLNQAVSQKVVSDAGEGGLDVSGPAPGIVGVNVLFDFHGLPL